MSSTSRPDHTSPWETEEVEEEGKEGDKLMIPSCKRKAPRPNGSCRKEG